MTQNLFKPASKTCAAAPLRWRGAGLATALVAGLVAGTLGAKAEVIVVQSNAKNITAGTVLADNAKIDIPAGRQAVFVLPSGATRTISGPFKGTGATLTKGVKSNAGVFDAVKRYVVTGGTSDRTVGAARSAAPAFSFGAPLPFSWRIVPVTASGDFCIEKGASIELVRQRTTKEERLTLIDLKSQRRSSIVFRKNAEKVKWPDDIEIDPRATYAVVGENRPMRQLRMRLIGPLPDRADTLRVLHGQRCETQFRAYIGEIQKAAR